VITVPALKAAADGIEVLKDTEFTKGIISKSGNSKCKSQSHRQHWGVHLANPQKSIFKRLGAPTNQSQFPSSGMFTVP